MEIQKKIKEVRKAKGILQKTMALKLNISISTYQKIEQGIMVLSIDRFLEICRILEIDSYNLLLPKVDSKNVENIEDVLINGISAFVNIRRNAKDLQTLIRELIKNFELGKINPENIIEEMKFSENYLAIILRESNLNEYEFIMLKKLIEKID